MDRAVGTRFPGKGYFDPIGAAFSISAATCDDGYHLPDEGMGKGISRKGRREIFIFDSGGVPPLWSGWRRGLSDGRGGGEPCGAGAKCEEGLAVAVADRDLAWPVGP